MLLDVVILNYNSSKDTIKLTKSLMTMDKLVNNIVIVDNNSSENDKQSLLNGIEELNCKENVHMIYSEINAGYAAGNNVGLRYVDNMKSTTELVAIMNPDISIEEKQLRGLLKSYELTERKYGKESIGVFSPWMINNEHSSGIVGWKMPYFLSDIISASVVLKKLTGDVLTYKNLSRDSGILEVDVLPGSFLLMKKVALKNIGYLDESTFLYCEERILASRMKKNGYRSFLDTGHYYYHEHSKTINKFLSDLKKIDYLYNSKKIYYIKEKQSKLQSGIISNLRFFSKMEYFIIYNMKNLLKRYRNKRKEA